MTSKRASAPDIRPRSLQTHVVGVESDLLGGTAAAIIADFIRQNPEGVLGVATGSTPEPIYLALAEARRAGLRTERLALVALDEYVGLAADDPRGYAHYVHERIAVPLGIAAGRVLVPQAAVLGAEPAAAEHERRITELGGVGVQLVGIGTNGHIGFNEPGSSFDDRTRVVTLAETTRRDNARYFGGDADAVPQRAVTQGIATILDAGHIVLVARGAGKQSALAAALEGPVNEAIPASALQRHPRVTVIADHAALG